MRDIMITRVGEMKKLFALFIMLAVSAPAFAATPATGRGRASAIKNMDARAAATTKQVGGSVASTEEAEKETQEVAEEEVKKDMRERERSACIQNNIGVGSTFVWASRYSNTANYASMVEDVEFPENNVCFVKVGLKSDDSRIDVSDVPTKYFVMGQTITCGSWANEETIRQRILDAKKSGRTWATVGGAVGGAGIGVGAMELFGNKMIGGAVEGQAALDGNELLCSQMKTLKSEKSSKYNEIKRELQNLKELCDSDIWTETDKDQSIEDKCREYDFEQLLKC